MESSQTRVGWLYFKNPVVLFRDFPVRVEGWRRRADSNRCIEVLQTSPLTTWVRRPTLMYHGVSLTFKVVIVMESLTKEEDEVMIKNLYQ